MSVCLHVLKASKATRNSSVLIEILNDCLTHIQVVRVTGGLGGGGRRREGKREGRRREKGGKEQRKEGRERGEGRKGERSRVGG